MSFFSSLGNIFGNMLTFGAYGQEKAMKQQARQQRDAINRANEETRRANLVAQAEKKVSADNEAVRRQQLADMNAMTFEFGGEEKDTNVLPNTVNTKPRGSLALNFISED